MPIKRSVKRISPGRVDAFDDHLWPVVVALCVLSAIGFGAILTLLSGPMMWFSLLVLPAITAAAMLSLSRMDDSVLRRTLQFSLILSLAGHLIVLIVASLLLIFNSGRKQNWQQTTQRNERTIEFSSQNSSVSIPVSKEDNAPEPDVEIRRNKTQVTSAEQPLPVPQTSPSLSPQTRRRETTRQTLPRFDESLSKLRSNRLMQQMKNSIAVKSTTPTENAVVPKQPAAAAPKQTGQSESVAAAVEADSIARSSSKATKQEVVRDAKPKPTSKQPTPRQSAQSASRRVQNNTPSRLTQVPRALPQQRIAHARKQQETVQIRKQSDKSKPSSAAKSGLAKSSSEQKPAESSGQLTRRPRQSKVASTSDAPSPLTRKMNSQPAKGKLARRLNPTQRSLTRPLSTSNAARLATSDAPTIRSMEPANRPSPNPKSSTAATTIEPAAISISKGQSGIAGGGSQQNLRSGLGGLPSPAVKPSDSMLSRREQSSSSSSRMLTNTRAAEVRRSVAESSRPTSAFLADTINVAKISGSKSPQLETKESAAADITSSSSESPKQFAIDKGEGLVNLGPTKVVAEARRRELSGGGSPRVASLSPSKTRRSSDESDTRPSLANSVIGPTAAPRETAAEPMSADFDEPTEFAELDRRSEGPDSQLLEHDAAVDVDPTADEGNFTALQRLANRGDVAADGVRSRLEQMLKELEFSEDEDDEEEKERLLKLLGNVKARIAAAPKVDTEQNPVAGSQSDTEIDDGGASAVAEVVSRLSSSGPFSTADLIGRSVTQLAIEAATSLPVADGALARRDAPRESGNAKRILDPATPSTERAPAEAAPNVSSDLAMLPQPVSGDGSSASEASFEDDGTEANLVRVAAAPSDAGFALEVDALNGPAGLSITPDVTSGVNRRPASEKSHQLQPELDTRFYKEDFGGAPAMNPTATIAKEAFRQRTPGMAQRRGEPKTEAAIHQGLEFLARYQLPDGSWSLVRFDTEHPLHKRQLDSDMAATALAVLAFQGAGYSHLEFKYSRQVNHAIRWLIQNQAEDGMLYIESDAKSNNACRLYSHGIAALALTEAYGMTQDPTLKEPAQKALDYIANSQHPDKGAWRYFAEMRMRSSDTSVSGWMVMALQSGRLSGLDVKDSTFEGIAKWLSVAADPVNESLYRYNPYAVNTQGVSRIKGRNASPSMTAVGLLMRIYTGWQRDDPRLISGVNYLIDQQMPGETQQLRDTYYWYYATQVLKHVDGPQWQKWNNALRPMLIGSQEKSGDYAGSWDPYDPVPDRWAPFGGRLYVTTMNLLSLEVRHRLLPLYQKTNSVFEEPNGVIISETLVE